jgi:heat shock protein HslJ
MACAATATMEQARAYIEALSVAASYRVKGEQLQLLAASGRRARHVWPPQPVGLANTAWRVDGLNNGKGASRASCPTARSRFRCSQSDGQASGSSGCNRWNASYDAESPRVKLRRADPHAQDLPGAGGHGPRSSSFLQSLAGVATSRIEGDRLEFRNADGAIVVTLHREGAD